MNQNNHHNNDHNNKKIELLLPAGNIDCLRAAVNNGANAVYLGLEKFSARQFAGNFNLENIYSVVEYCHSRNVNVYIALNTLIKNSEIEEYFEMISVAYAAKADAIIIQDSNFIPLIKANFPGLKIHLSTQAVTTNTYSIPEDVDRVVLPRELSNDEICEFTKKMDTEIFVHGALCFCYSGLCLFSSLVGGRSGNRGMCAQPCRKMYNNKYAISTMDLCMIEKIPQIIKSGVKSIKIEGRMRSAVYVGTTARIYRKYIDKYYDNKEYYGQEYNVDKKDIEELMLAFNRELTKGFAYEKTIVDTRKPMNRGLFLGVVKKGVLKLRTRLKIGDGIGIWLDDKENVGYTVKEIIKDGKKVNSAKEGDSVELDFKNAKEGSPVYKTSSIDMKIKLGDEIIEKKYKLALHKTKILELPTSENYDTPRIFVKIYNKKQAVDALSAKADIIYYDALKNDCEEVKKIIKNEKNTKFFLFTPRISDDKEVDKIVDIIYKIKPDGVLIANRGFLKKLKGCEIHIDYSMNAFNDIDINEYSKIGIPIISPELNKNEIIELKNKNIIVQAHGDLVLMTAKEPMTAPELIDEEGRHFRVRKTNNGYHEILNYRQIGLFNKTKEYLKCGIKYFYIDLDYDSDKYVRIYRKIINNVEFDDAKIKKGYTTGHYDRGVN